MRFTASAEKALSRSDEAAAEYGCPFTGSEHLLIALLSDNECAAYKLLKARGVTFKSVTSMLPLNMQRSVCADGSTRRVRSISCSPLSPTTNVLRQRS